MKKWMIVIAVVLLGCDTTEDYLLKMNRNPRLVFTYEDENLMNKYDSVKKNRGFDHYDFAVTASDYESDKYRLTYYNASGDGLLMSNGDVSDGGWVNLTTAYDGIYDISYYPDAVGIHTLYFILYDEFLETDTVRLELVAFENLPPVANLKVTSAKVVDDFEYILDASESYDKDASYGGYIEFYEFHINSRVIKTREPRLAYVFSGEQIASIRLRVQDDDGKWSSFSDLIVSID